MFKARNPTGIKSGGFGLTIGFSLKVLTFNIGSSGSSPIHTCWSILIPTDKDLQLNNLAPSHTWVVFWRLVVLTCSCDHLVMWCTFEVLGKLIDFHKMYCFVDLLCWVRASDMLLYLLWQGFEAICTMFIRSKEIAKIWDEENVQSSFHNCRLFDEVKCYRRRLNLKTKNILFARNNMSDLTCKK